MMYDAVETETLVYRYTTSSPVFVWYNLLEEAVCVLGTEHTHTVLCLKNTTLLASKMQLTSAHNEQQFLSRWSPVSMQKCPNL